MRVSGFTILINVRGIVVIEGIVILASASANQGGRGRPATDPSARAAYAILILPAGSRSAVSARSEGGALMASVYAMSAGVGRIVAPPAVSRTAHPPLS